MLSPNKKITSKLIEILDFCAILAILWSVTISFLIDQIVKSGYMPNATVLIRFSFFCVFISVAAGYRLIKPYGMLALLSGRNFAHGLISITAIILSLTSFVLTFKNYDLNNLSFLVAAVYLVVFLWGFWSNHASEDVKDGYLNKWVVAILVLAALLIPLSAPKYLNSESYLNFQELKSIPLPTNKDLEDQADGWETFKFSNAQSSAILANVDYAKARFNDLNLSYYRLVKSDQGLTFSFNLLSKNKSPACLLVDYKADFNGLATCVDHLQGKSTKADTKENIDRLLDLSYVNDSEVRAKLLSDRDKLATPRVMVKPLLSPIHPLLADMLVRGAIYHHYNAILQTMYLAHSPIDYLGNQYGLGPLLLVKGVSELFHLKNFDALYFSITFSSIVVLLTLLLAIKDLKHRSLVLFGFSMSVLVTYGISNIIAPMLYFSRYIPIIFISMYLFSLALRDDNKNGRVGAFLFFVLMIVNALYSFEYGLVIGLAVLAVGVKYKDKIYCIVSLISLLTSIVVKFFLTQSLFAGMSFINSIAGIGMDGSMGPISTLFAVGIVALMLMMYRINQNSSVSKELQLLFYIVIALGFKLAWTGSGNHIGALFLLSALLLAATAQHQFLVIPGVASLRKLYVFINVLILLITFINIGYIQKIPSYHFHSLKYTQSSFSDFFKISEVMNEKVSAFKTIFREGDLVLSKNDDLLALSTEQLITKPNQNVSTNINYQIDELHILNTYIKGERVIVDKSLLRDDEYDYVATHYLNVNKKTDDYIYAYAAEVRKFNRVYRQLLNTSFVECQSNDYFLVLCRK